MRALPVVTVGTVGIDIDPQRIAEAKENAKKAGVEKLVRFEENDLFEADIHHPDLDPPWIVSRGPK